MRRTWLMAGLGAALLARGARADDPAPVATLTERVLAQVRNGIDWTTLRKSRGDVHVTYFAVPEQKRMIVFDGQEAGPFEGARPTSLRLSPDGRLVAFVSEVKGGEAMVLDARPGKTWQSVGDITFSPDGKHWAHTARGPGGHVVVVDRKEGPVFDGMSPYFAFSEDGKRFAYVAEKEDKWHVVVDHTSVSPPYDGQPLTPVFSRDGAHVAYPVEMADGWTVVLDGKETGRYEVVGQDTLRLGPDGKSVAFVAKKEGKWRLVVDGKEQGPYDAYLVGGLVLSPDGTRVACCVRSGGKWRVVLDGIAGPDFDQILPASLSFSADGTHVAYAGMRDGKFHAWIDGKETRAFTGPVTPVLGPAGAPAVWAAVEDEKGILGMGDREVALPGGLLDVPAFVSPDVVRILLLRDRKLFVVVDAALRAP